MAGMQLATDQPVTLALGLGASDDEATNATSVSLKRDFDSIVKEYESGWTHWLDSLKRPANADPLYEWSAVVLKAHMDKLHPGAAIASIAAPWGDTLRDNDLTQRGYRFVWTRDLYHAAMGLFTLGDMKSARQILDYMLEHIVQDNGSVPQNQFVKGNAHWTGIQLD
jgi:glucoamylase